MKYSGYRTLLSFALITSLLTLNSCEHDEGVAPTSVRKWDAFEIKAINEVPAPAGRTEQGEVTIELLSDNSLRYDFHIHNLTPSDALTAAHIHAGDAGTAGAVLIDLKPVFNGGGATGEVKNLRQGQIDSLLNQPVYFNVHSTQLTGGVARAQLDSKVAFAMDIPLSGNNEVPAVVTTATGNCLIRLTEDKTLYSRITVTGIESNDTLRVAHIHKAASGVNGPVRIFLANNIDEFGIWRKTTLVDSLYNMVKNDAMYVNAHSKLRGAGIVRGQIR